MSALEIQKQMLLLRSQAAKVFQRKAFKHVVWVGVFGPFSRAEQGIGTRVSLVIFYDPAYTEDQIWECYFNNEESDWDIDPDKFKLQIAWNRKVNILRIFEGALRKNTLHLEEQINGILHGQTVYGNFNHPVLQGIRSSCFQKAQEYEKKTCDSWRLADVASQSKDGSKEYQSTCLKIVDILDGNENDPLYGILVRIPRNFAKDLAKNGGRKFSKKSMEQLASMLYEYSVRAANIINRAQFAEDVRAKTCK